MKNKEEKTLLKTYLLCMVGRKWMLDKIATPKP